MSNRQLLKRSNKYYVHPASNTFIRLLFLSDTKFRDWHFTCRQRQLAASLHSMLMDISLEAGCHVAYKRLRLSRN